MITQNAIVCDGCLVVIARDDATWHYDIEKHFCPECEEGWIEENSESVADERREEIEESLAAWDAFGKRCERKGVKK